MPKKLAGLVLALALMLAVGIASAAPTEMFTGAIVREVREENLYLCDDMRGEQFLLLVGEDVQVDTVDDIDVNTVLFVFYTGVDGSEPARMTATRVMDAIVEGTVVNVDAQSARVRVDGAAFGRIWVELPATTDFDGILGQTIRVQPYGIEDVALFDMVQAREYTPVNVLSATILENTGDALILDTQAGDVRVVIGEQTQTFLPLGVGTMATVYYTQGDPATGEITADTIWGANG